jgi:gliding motility-associated-like protein
MLNADIPFTHFFSFFVFLSLSLRLSLAKINDTWELLIDPSLQLTGIQCKVFDRWGDSVFETQSVPVTWDGVFNGKQMEPGVYVYVLTLEIENGKKRILSGDLTVLR